MYVDMSGPYPKTDEQENGAPQQKNSFSSRDDMR